MDITSRVGRGKKAIPQQRPNVGAENAGSWPQPGISAKKYATVLAIMPNRSGVLHTLAIQWHSGEATIWHGVSPKTNRIADTSEGLSQWHRLKGPPASVGERSLERLSSPVISDARSYMWRHIRSLAS